MRKIAVEEAFATPGLLEELRSLIGGETGFKDPAFESIYDKLLFAPEMGELRKKLVDTDDLRIQDMDRHGIDVQILSLTAPGVQIFETQKAKTLTVQTNNFLLEVISRNPTRFYGLMAVSPADPRFSVMEIERMSRENNIVGIVVNSHTRGEYLDDEKFEDIFFAAEAKQLPVYLHPSTPAPQMADPYLPYGLSGPIWGFAAEAGLHALRLILSGVFDKAPGLNIILGHLGEGLPFWMNRLDSRLALASYFDASGKVEKLYRTPAYYMKENIFYSTSGMNSRNEINYVCEMCGESRVLFAIDYPYESTANAVEGIEKSDFSESRMRKIFFENSQSVFRRHFFE